MTLAERPLTSLQGVILTTGPFVFLWSTLRGYVSRNGPFSLARSLTRLNSLAYAAFSLALGFFILDDVFHFDMYRDSQFRFLSPQTEDLAYVYHMSKFYEYIDVFNLVAAGTVIGPHMAFHHLTTPFYTYFRVLNASEWQVFAGLNCFHHFWMYAYFGGVTAFRPILPITGWLQLIAGIAVDVRYLATYGSEAPESTNRAIGVLLLARYAMLFYEELTAGKSPATSSKAEEEKKDKEE